jgi:hypothetical protein
MANRSNDENGVHAQVKAAIPVALLALLLPASAGAQELPPPAESGKSSVGYDTVAEALAALKAKPGAVIREEADGWTVIDDDNALWSFTPEGHPAHPSVVKRKAVERDGRVVIEMAVLCESSKAPCDQLVSEFTELNEEIGAQARNESAPPAAPNPRDAEVEAFASHWLDLLEQEEADKSYAFLADVFKSNMTIDEWRVAVAETKERLGALRSRSVRRIVWYEDPADAPLPGTYIAIEFDSVYEKAPRHFRYVVLHTQGDEPFRVMRDESTIDGTPVDGP